MNTGDTKMARAFVLDEHIETAPHAEGATFEMFEVIVAGRKQFSLARGLVLAVFAIGSLACGSGSHTRDSLPDAVAAAIRAQYQSTGAEVRYFAASADLDDDGQDEIIVHLVGPMICGTGGCPTLVFRAIDSGYQLVSVITITRPPIQMSASTANGWHNLIVLVAGGGVASFDAELEFDGSSYPSNPTVPPARKTESLQGATVLIADFDSLQEAKLLGDN